MATCIIHRRPLTNELGEELCISCIEEAAIQSMKNFGRPEGVYCADCGMYFEDLHYFYTKHVPCESASC